MGKSSNNTDSLDKQHHKSDHSKNQNQKLRIKEITQISQAQSNQHPETTRTEQKRHQGKNQQTGKGKEQQKTGANTKEQRNTTNEHTSNPTTEHKKKEQKTKSIKDDHYSCNNSYIIITFITMSDRYNKIATSRGASQQSKRHEDFTKF